VSVTPANGINHMQLKFTSDTDLVLLCKSGDRKAWNEFFRRLMPLIKTTIRRTLKVDDNVEDPTFYGLDVVSEIMLLLLIKFYQKGILDQLEDISGVRPWLKTVVKNITKEWLISQGRLKHATSRVVRRRMRSLDAPLNQDTDATLLDTFDLDIPDNQDIRDYIETLLHVVEAKANRRDYWIVRLSLISQISLDSDEESSLIDFSPLPQDPARQLIQDMIMDVESRTKKCDAKLGLAITLGSELELTQYILWEMRGDDTPQGLDKINELERKCLQLEKRRKKLILEGIKIPRPRNAEIAVLVGIDPKQESNVTTILTRSREKLRKIPVTIWDDEE
jgi:DNA-directed RNA polymerase specialized sigma24 family protein